MVSNANVWVKFFFEAGIPKVTAAKYAHVFYENRIQMDMLQELNKEYLREMGIIPMGDVIAILRHSKSVFEQNARDKILTQEIEIIPVATVSANSVGNSNTQARNEITSSKIIKTSKSTNSVIPMPKQPRRVLPEHEGGYKITLPTGSTTRSKEILAKKAMLYSDRDSSKQGVFDRLSKFDNTDQSAQQTTSSNSLDKHLSSVFRRLGHKDNIDEEKFDEKQTIRLAGIIKTTKLKAPIGITKAKAKTQKVILVKKQPAKAATMVADEYESGKIGEKSVSFSSEDEVLEIAPRPTSTVKFRGKNVNISVAGNSVKDRLGNASRSVNKQHLVRVSSQTGRTLLKSNIKMKSDDVRTIKTPVQSRLNLKKKINLATSSDKNITLRIGKSPPARRLSEKSREPSLSVFERLGFH